MCYELSWLHDSGLPGIGVLEIIVPASSPAIVESKSLKLYLNSFAQSSFSGFEHVGRTIAQDISRAVKDEVSVVIFPPDQWEEIVPTPHMQFIQWAGTCIDTIPVSCMFTEPDRSILKTTRGERVSERLYSHLLRTLCPVTQQPDWATVQISYTGTPIDHGSLLQYLVSFRNHLGFHEACCERILADIGLACTPDMLSVSCLFTRRGGIDITPVRSFGDADEAVSRVRVPRQ
jgi:7-cyano-7-deazaguanine reductase